MYFLQQYKKQFFSNIFSYAGENPGGNIEGVGGPLSKPEEGPEKVDPAKALKRAESVNGRLGDAVDAELARNLVGGEGSDTLDSNAEGDTLTGDDGGDALKDGGEAYSEGPGEVDDSADYKDSVPSLDDVRAAATRNGVAHMGEESGEKDQNEDMSYQERQKAISNLETNRSMMEARMNEYKPGTPERAAAEREMNAIQMLANILIYGSINPPQVDSQGRAIPHSPGRNSFGGSIGEPLSGEMLERYGQAGHEFATWIKNRGFPVYEGKPFYCGKNVGECMNEYGFQGLPNSGRNGADWAQICRDRPNQFKQIQCTPQEAPAGALISYERNTGGSKARQESGHIEIALGNNSGYYFGQVASAPGGSNKSFDAGTYTVWMPISKTA